MKTPPWGLALKVGKAALNRWKLLLTLIDQHYNDQFYQHREVTSIDCEITLSQSASSIASKSLNLVIFVHPCIVHVSVRLNQI